MTDGILSLNMIKVRALKNVRDHEFLLRLDLGKEEGKGKKKKIAGIY